MGIPDYQSIILPLLNLANNHTEVAVPNAVKELSISFNLSESEKAALLPSGHRTIFSDRVHWASMYLKHAGLLQRTKRGYYKITPLGRTVLKEKPTRIDKRYLSRFPSFLKFARLKNW